MLCEVRFFIPPGENVKNNHINFLETKGRKEEKGRRIDR